MARPSVLPERQSCQGNRWPYGLRRKVRQLSRRYTGHVKRECPLPKNAGHYIAWCLMMGQSLLQRADMLLGRIGAGWPFAPSPTRAFQCSLATLRRPLGTLAPKCLCQMIVVGRKYRKIFWTVIRNVAIQVVNNFTRLKWATEHLLCNQTMLTRVAMHIGKGVSGDAQQDIATLIDHPATLPVGVVFHVKVLCREWNSGVKQDQSDIGLSAMEAAGNLGLRDILSRPINHLLTVADRTIRILRHISLLLPAHIIRVYRNMSNVSSICGTTGSLIWRCPARGTTY